MVACLISVFASSGLSVLQVLHLRHIQRPLNGLRAAPRLGVTVLRSTRLYLLHFWLIRSFSSECLVAFALANVRYLFVALSWGGPPCRMFLVFGLSMENAGDGGA